MHIGSEEHKQLFCRSFIDAHRPYEPADMPWPELDEVSLARLRAIPIWTMALEVEINAGAMLAGYAKTESDPLVRQALELQGFEEDRHGRILQHMIQRYGLTANPKKLDDRPTRGAFVDFGYNECVDSFAGFGIFKLACDSRILPEALTSLFSRVLLEEANHIVFFVNWIAWDRTRRGCRGAVLQAIPTLICYGSAIVRRIKGGTEMSAGDKPAAAAPEDGPILDLFGDILQGLTPAKFVRACVEENDRYMREFDPRLLRPRFIPTLAKIVLAGLESFERIRGAFAREARA
ncbi:MAG TPA: hypothetical protein VNG31_03980 [Candidatus Baltobacteraceae bacterium]|nr:hypothetical protein [Candidatus Baltobacteraceae bacterium]